MGHKSIGHGHTGLHHLHHLFPTIDAADLSKIVPLFEQHCEEWGVTFSTMPTAALAKGMWKCIDGQPPSARTRNGIHAPKDGKQD